MNYEQLGLKCGLEIHQQLGTGKLFCKCPSDLQERAPDLVVKRKLHAVAGELGEIDPAAMQAALRGATYVYQFYNDSNCLVELDEEPPHPVNKDALETVLLVSKLVNAKILDEIHVMRKTVIDGSNTSGFQRTSLISTGGELKFPAGKIGIQSICLEEDAARIIKAKEDEIIYNLDRLGTPLIEIATAPDIKTPEQAREVALAIGLLLRATRKVKRGIGTIRQDLNISIENGARVEIKGIQELNLIPKAVECEVQRQLALLSLKEDLIVRNAPKLKQNFLDITKLFENTQSKIIKKALEFGKVVFALKLEKFAGLLKKQVSPDRRFGTELADYAQSVGAFGLFHSDELPDYGITEGEVQKIRQELSLPENDAFILIADLPDMCKKALNKIVERANLAFEQVPEETRKANQDGTSSYLRPLPGKARMYPETDLMPINTGAAIVRGYGAAKIPKLPWDEISALEKKYKISKQLASELYDSDKTKLFARLSSSTKISPTIIANTLTNVLNSLSPEIDFGEKQFLDLFNSLNKGKFSKDAIPQVLEAWLKAPDRNLNDIIAGIGIEKISQKDLEKIIDSIISKNAKLISEKGEAAIQPLMGDIMKEMRGKADGKVIIGILRKKLRLDK